MANGELGEFKDYLRLFEVTDMPFFVSDTLLQNYKNLECLFINSKHIWTCFIPKNAAEATARDGLTLYGSRQDFHNYQREFEEYKKRSANLFEDLSRRDELTGQDIEEFLKELNLMHTFYLKTEFFYTDEAFKLSAENKTIKDNIDQLGQVKNAGREYLNQIFFGNDSWISKIFHVISNQFNIEESDLWQYTQRELRNIETTKPAQPVLLGRRQDYYILATAEEVATVIGKDATHKIKELFSTEVVAKQEVKGQIANKGVARGRVRIIKYGYQEFNKLNKQIEQMVQGEILVAETTSPELTTACHKASAIVTNQGGLMSHAAIIARELGIPCIVGTGDATEVLLSGDVVEVNADRGVVTKQ